MHEGCRRLPRAAYHGLTRGACRTALLLMLASWLGGCDAAWPPLPPPQSFTFTITASLKAAVQAFNANAALALAEYGPITETHQAKESSRSFRTAWLPGATARVAAPAAPPHLGGWRDGTLYIVYPPWAAA